MSIIDFIKKGEANYTSLPDALKKSVDFANRVTKNGNDTSTYKSNESIKRTIDLSIEKLNVFLSSREDEKPKAQKEKKSKSTKESKRIFFKDLPGNHPLNILDVNSSQYKQALKEYNSSKHNAEPIFKVNDKVISSDYPNDVKTINKIFEIKKGKFVPGSSTIPEVEFSYYFYEGGSSYEKDIKLAQSQKRHAENKQTSKKVKAEATHKVEELPIEIQIIKRFVSFVGKEKTAKQVMSLLDFVQKAIITKKVRKTSEYADQIIYIQKSLADAYNVMSKSGVITIEFKNGAQANEYTSIVTDYEPLKSVALIKRYINLDGKATIEKAFKLKDDIQKFFNNEPKNVRDPYAAVLNEMELNLINYVNGVTKELPINSQSLNGILTTIARGGLTALRYGAKGAKAGAKFIKPIAQHVAVSAIKTYHAADKKLAAREKKESLGGISDEVMSVSDAKSQKFSEIGFTGDYLKLIGKACEPTSILIYGRGGSGKSGLSLGIADFLCKKGKSILYVAGEQFNTPTFTELLNKTGVTGGERFKIVKGLYTLPISGFDVVVIDSKDSIGILKSSEFKALRDAYPDKIWIITSQGTKAGDFTGDEKWRNEVDTLIYCENGVASTEEDKNRWGAKASIKIF